MANEKVITLDNLEKFKDNLDALLDNKVDKKTGKGLSTNDYTNEEKTKLAGIENNATRTIVVASTQNGYIVVNDGQVKVYDDTEVRELIAGKKTAWVINTEDQITGLKDADGNYINVTRIGNLNISLIKVGDDIYIKDDNVPDYWVTSREVEEGVVILSLHKSNTKIDLDDYYTKEEIDELISNLDNILLINSGKTPNLDDNSLNKLYRHKRTNENVTDLNKVVKTVTPAGDLIANCNTSRNGVQLSNYETLNGCFDRSLNDLYGEDFTVSGFINIYTAYYPNIEDVSVSAIRMGTKNPGSIVLTNFSKSTLKIIAGKYFSYNGSTQQKSYDANSKLVITWNDGVSTTIDLTEDPVEYEVNLTDFDSSYPVEIYASGSSNDGRVFVYGFVAEGEEQVDYSLHNLTTEDDIQEVNERIDETNNEVSRVDSKVDQVDSKVDSVNDDLQATKETIGHVQVFNAKYLPRASRDYIDKILRVNGVLYQLKVNGEEKEYSFENVTGTTEVKPETWSDFASLITNGFTEDFELAYTENIDWITPVQLTAGKEYRTNNLPNKNVEFFLMTNLNNVTITGYYSSLSIEGGSIPCTNINHMAYLIGEDGILFADINHVIDGRIYTEDYTKPQVYFTCNDPTGFDPNNIGAINYLEEKQINTEYLISKIFRNDGFAKFGSSSVGGKLTIRKINDSLPSITKVILKVKTWSATKNAGVISSVGTYLEDNVVSANEEIQNVTIYNKQDAGSTDVISLESYRPDYGDVRFNLAGIIVTFGEASYEWAPIGGWSGGGTNKQIILSTRKINVLADPDNVQFEKFKKILIRLTLLNFDENDIGSKICLYNYTYRTSGRKYPDVEGGNTILSCRKKRYIHPADYYKHDNSHCIGIGVDLQNIKSNHPDFKIPSWIPNDGYMKTEWLLTQQDISRGYLELDGGYEFLPLIKPSDFNDQTGEWVYSFSGKGRFIKFALHDKNDNMIIMSNNQLKLSSSRNIIIEYCFDGVYRICSKNNQDQGSFIIK